MYTVVCNLIILVFILKLRFQLILAFEPFILCSLVFEIIVPEDISVESNDTSDVDTEKGDEGEPDLSDEWIDGICLHY